MYKAVLPGVFSSVTDQSNSGIKNHYAIHLAKNKNARAASHLHQLFFGAKRTESKIGVVTDHKTEEPDYFSSYE
jgi:hypothetical protein